MDFQAQFDMTTTFNLLRETGHDSVLSAWKAPKSAGLSVARSTTNETFLHQQLRMSDWNSYVALNPSRGAGKPSFDSVTKVCWMVLDFDPDSRGDGLPCWGPVNAVLQNNSIIPAGWVSTGRGYQCWIRLDDVAVSKSVADRIIKGITKFIDNAVGDMLEGSWHIDPSCADIARIVRLPGSINHKTGSTAYWLETPIPEPNKLLFLGRFAVPESAPPEPLTDFKLRHLGPALQPVNLSFLMYGCDTHLDSRHRRLYSLAADLFDLGTPAGLAKQLLYGAASRCVPNLNSTDPEAVERLVAQKWS